ncbi:MAG: DUF2235 domain-containing protein [Pseudomonadota bacterium]
MPDRPPKTHVFIFDGTLSKLTDGHETNAGLLYKLLTENGAHSRQSVGYDAGIQGEGWRKWVNVAAGVTINLSIMAGYAALCSRYQPGDKIMLFGYSRGAYAARSLAGFIGRVGLLRRRHAMHRRVERAFRYYEAGATSAHARRFSERFCRRDVPVEMIGVWDTVRALGLPYPGLNRLAPMATEFHDHKLGRHVAHAFHALALDENRTAFSPLLWQRQPGWPGYLEQMWFAGAHADVGGQTGGHEGVRPLSNIPLVWMLRRAEMCGLLLPPDWEQRFHRDPAAPMRGNRKGLGKYFILRAPRVAGLCGSEHTHPSVARRSAALPGYQPKAQWISQTSEEMQAAAKPAH